MCVVQEIDEDSKLVEGLKKIRIIAKATRTLVNLSSFERSESVVSKRVNDGDRVVSPVAGVTESAAVVAHDPASRSQSCSAIRLAPAVHVSPSISASRARGVSLACSFDDSASVHLRSVYGSTEQRSVWPSESKLTREDTVTTEPAQQGEPVSQETNPKADNIADWSILIPTVLDVLPPIEAAKLARTDTPSVVLSGQEEIPQEPPDCFPQSIHQKCGCWENWGCLKPVCRQWRAGREALLQVVKHPAFEWSILILIFGSSITLCFEDIYLEENPRLMSILRWTNMAFAILFALEMVIKWFALGLKYYFSSVWTALDFVIVTVSVISVAVEDSANLSALRSLRTLRALRPLRAISRWQGMKVRDCQFSFGKKTLMCVYSFLDCRQRAHVRHSGHFQRAARLPRLLVGLFHPGRPAVWWQVLQVHRRRNGRTFPATGCCCCFLCALRNAVWLLTVLFGNGQIIDTKADCLGRNMTWKNSPIHFDHVGHAYLALFQVVSALLSFSLSVMYSHVVMFFVSPMSFTSKGDV